MASSAVPAQNLAVGLDVALKILGRRADDAPVTVADPAPHERILFVDDSELYRAAYRAVFEDAGDASFETDLAADGRRALALVQRAVAQRRRYAVAFVDACMPGWDGIETIERLRAADPGLEVVLCSEQTAAAYHGLDRRMGAADAVPFLAKPAESLEIVQLARALARKRAYREKQSATAAEREAELGLARERLAGEARARARMEAELRLAQKLEAVGQLAAGIAHEINTPMQYIGDSVHYLRDAFDELLMVAAGDEAGAEVDLEHLRARGKRAFERTLDGVERVGAIVRALRQFAHPDRQEMAPADLNRALEAALTVSRNEHKYVADVTTELGELPLVECHLGEINQVFLNLIVNAAHAVGAAPRDRRGTIAVRTRAAGDLVHVVIEDSGCGIPEGIRDRVFDPFFTTKPVGKGTGQGLAIARNIVERHRGRLTFESEVGRGTTFTIELPVRAAAAAGAAAGEP